MLNTDQAKRFARYAIAKRKLEAKAKQIGKKLDKWADPMINHMITEEIKALSIKGGITLSLQQDLWAKILAKDEDGIVDKARVVKALEDAGLKELVTAESYNSNSLSAYLRERIKSEEEFPESFEGVIGTSPKFKIVVRKI